MTRKSNTKHTLALAVASVVALSGCGGGGSSSSAGGGDGSDTIDVQEPDSFTTTLSSQQINEGNTSRIDLAKTSTSSQATSAAIRVRAEGDVDAAAFVGQELADMAKAAESSNPSIEARIDDGVLILESEETDRPQSAEVVIGDSTGLPLALVNVALLNTSAFDLESEAEAWVGNRTRLVNLSEAKALYKFEALQDYTKGNITASEYQTVIDQWQVSQRPTADDLNQQIDSVDNAYGRYQNGEISDSKLSDIVSQARLGLRSHETVAEGLKTDAESRGVTFETQMGEASFHQPSDSFSRFVGRESLGTQTDSGWVFDSDAQQFAMLTEVGGLASCYAGGLE